MKKTAAILAFLLLAGTLPSLAETSLLTKDGTLFEALLAPPADAVVGYEGPAPGSLVVRVTAPDGSSRVETVSESTGQDGLKPWVLEFEPATQTLFVVYTQSTGVMSNVFVAMRRNLTWSSRVVLANPGLYLSLNPKAVVTRQSFRDVDAAGKPVAKVRSILSLVWWEENGSSQARYAPVFVEDGILKLDEIAGYNLNELAGSTGATTAGTLPVSAYAFPAIQRDPASNGGVTVSFANLADQTHTALRISFPEDVSKLLVERPGEIALAQARAHVPVGREPVRGRIQISIDTAGDVEASISPSGVTNFYWQAGPVLRYIGSDAAAGVKPKAIHLRKDLSLDKAVSIVREMTARD